MQGVIKDQHWRRLNCEASERLIAKIRQEKQEAKGSVDAFLRKARAGSLREYLQRLVESEDRERHDTAEGTCVVSAYQPTMSLHHTECRWDRVDRPHRVDC